MMVAQSRHFLNEPWKNSVSIAPYWKVLPVYMAVQMVDNILSMIFKLKGIKLINQVNKILNEDVMLKLV